MVAYPSDQYAHSLIDQSAADLVLLSTSLDKSKRITDKLSKMLNGFNDRLSKLEKTLAPIHNETKTLSRINANIDETILAVNQVLSNHDTALRQELVIQNRPDANQLGPYMAALDDVMKSTSEMKRTGANTNDSSQQVEKLLETGIGHLLEIFVDWVKTFTGSPLSDPIRQTVDGSQPLGFSTMNVTQLSSLYTYLEEKSTAFGASRTLDSFKQIPLRYAKIRSQYVAQSLKPAAKSAVQTMRNGSGTGVFSSFVACLFDLFVVEHQSIVAIFKGINPKEVKNLYAQVILSSLELFSETGQAVHGVIKLSLSSYIGAAFEIYAVLSEYSDRFEVEVRRRSGRKENEMGELFHSFRGSCLRSLPEFIADTKTFGEKLPVGSESSNTMTSEMAIAVVDYLKMLCNHQEMVESFLGMLGDGNWIFPSSSGSLGRPQQSSDSERLLEKYLGDALSALYAAVEARSKNLKLPASAASTITSATARNGIGSIYALNNFIYIRREVLESKILDILGESVEEELNKKVRMYKVRYLEIWSPLISALMDGGVEDHSKGAFGLGAVKSALPGQQAGAERRDVKDRFGRFNDAFEEVINLHKIARVDDSDPEIKEKLRDEIERMIVPTYAKFTQRHEGGQFSKHPSKYLKMTADQLEDRLDSLFQQ